jgi:hypothetical protein
MSASTSNPFPADESSDICVWVVRGGRNGETVIHNLEENVVTLGWGDWLTEAGADGSEDSAALDRTFNQRFGHEHHEKTRQRAREEILRFRDGIRIGNLVVLPLGKHATADAWIAVSKVSGPAVHDPDQPDGARLRRPVEWLHKGVPKSDVEPDLQSSLGARLTVFQPRTEGAARRILQIATDGADDGPLRCPWPALSGDEAGVESEGGHEIPEGAKSRVMVNRYERDPVARIRCLDHFGYECQVCCLKFEERYGEVGREFMHVHHKKPLSEIADHDNHQVNPLEDLVPVCPNCHAMLHMPTGRTLTVEELRRRMDEAPGDSW